MPSFNLTDILTNSENFQPVRQAGEAYAASPEGKRAAAEDEEYERWSNDPMTIIMHGPPWGDANAQRARREFWKTTDSYKTFNQKWTSSAPTAADPAMQAEAMRGGNLAGALDQFAQEMLKPLDMNDPTVKRIFADVQGRSQMNANLRGVQGGLSNMATEKAIADAGLAHQFGRQQLGAQALTNGLSDARGQERFREDQYRYDTGLSQQVHQGKVAQGQASGALTGGLIGSLGYLGGPALGAATMTAGTQLGGGMGGMSAGQWQPPQRGGLSGGGRGY